jgi:hypothetical protein
MRVPRTQCDAKRLDAKKNRAEPFIPRFGPTPIPPMESHEPAGRGRSWGIGCIFGCTTVRGVGRKARPASKKPVDTGFELVEMRRLELLTPYMRSKCSTS